MAQKSSSNRIVVLVVILAVALIAVYFLSKPAQAATKKDLKVAYVYVGPVGDGGWTYAHDLGRKHLVSKGVKTAFVESVAESDSYRTIRNLAQNNDIVFTTSFGFMDPTLKAANQFPNVTFMHCSGFKTSKNMGNYFGRMYQAKYLAGMVAGAMSKTNRIGVIGSHPISEIIRHINAFTLGVQAVKPDAEVQVLWINSWFDPAKEVEATNSLIDNGADIIAITTDSAAPLQTAQKRNILSIGNDSDMSKFAPDSHLTAAVFNWGVIYEDIYNKVKDGTWLPSSEWWGLETGLVGLSPYSKLVPEDLQKTVNAKREEIGKGLKVFKGPITKQDGTLALEDGKAHTDQELLSMNYFVKGVIGDLPKN
jgi:basic membrane protein A and related proteins